MNAQTCVRLFLINAAVVGALVLRTDDVAAAVYQSEKSPSDLERRLAETAPEKATRKKGVLYTQLGYALYKEGRMAEAAKAYEAALEQPARRSLRRHIYLYLGKSYESSGRVDKALAAYEEAVRHDRKNWRRHRDLGLIAERVHLLPMAIASYKEAVRLEPSERSVRLDLARALRRYGLYREALVHLEKAAGEEGLAKAIAFEESRVLEGLGRYRRAAHAYEESLGAETTIADWGRMIYLAYLADDKDGANRAMERLVRLDPPPKDLRFYEALVAYMGDRPLSLLRPDRWDAALREVIEPALDRQKDSNP